MKYRHRVLALLAARYATSRWAGNFARLNAAHAAMTAGVGTIAYSVTLVLTDGVLGMPSMDAAVVARLTLAAAIYNAVLAPFAIELIWRLRALARDAPEPA